MGMWLATHVMSIDKLVFYFIGTFSLGFICGALAVTLGLLLLYLIATKL